MSFHPRQTTDTGESSNSKPKRCSRIDQPIRRPSMRKCSSLERSSSVNRIDNTANLLVSAAKRSRSSSATPMRTLPTRLMTYASPAILMTDEMELSPFDDKKVIPRHTARITKYLHAIGKDFFQRGGLSTKQFVVIFEHLLNFIVGNRFKISTNFVEDIVKVLAQIKYPFTINKSWLKTPNAARAFSDVVVLLGWMLQFVAAPDVVREFENELLLPATENMPNSEYALKFVVSAQEWFYHWNNNKIDEFDRLKKYLSDDFIKRAGMESLDFIDSEIKRFSTAVQKLDRVKWKEECSKFDRECADLEHNMHLNQRHLTNLEKSRAENCQEITQLEEMIGSKEKHNAEQRQVRIKTIENIVRTQQMSIKDREELISLVHSLKQLLDSKKDREGMSHLWMASANETLFGTTGNTCPKQVRWWTQSLRGMRRIVRRHRKMFQRARCNEAPDVEEAKRAYKSVMYEYKIAIKTAKITALEKVCRRKLRAAELAIASSTDTY